MFGGIAHMDKSAHPSALIVFLPFCFVGFWCAICFILSLLGGWHRLAARFPVRSKPSGKNYVMQSGKVGLVNYRSCLDIYVAPEGFYISVFFLFRLGHPPLFIPRDSVFNVTTHRFLWADSVVFDVGSPRVARLQLPKRIFESRDVVG